MLRLIIQTKRRYKKIEQQESKTNEEIEETDTNDLDSTDDESGDGLSTTNDVDSEVVSEDDADEEIDTTLIEEEDWIEYKKEAQMKPRKRWSKNSMLEQDSQKMKWKLALRIATSPSDRWLRKAAVWNLELSTRYRINSDWETKKMMGR